MPTLDIFGDQRKIPQLYINVKVKTKTSSAEEATAFNKVFGYIMKKPRTKYEFLSVSSIRNIQLSNIYLIDIKPYISDEDYAMLNTIENIFNSGLTSDVKAFILAILHVPFTVLEEISKHTA